MRLILICDECGQWIEYDPRITKTHQITTNDFSNDNIDAEFESEIENIDDVQNSEFGESDLNVANYELKIKCKHCGSSITIRQE